MQAYRYSVEARIIQAARSASKQVYEEWIRNGYACLSRQRLAPGYYLDGHDLDVHSILPANDGQLHRIAYRPL